MQDLNIVTKKELFDFLRPFAGNYGMVDDAGNPDEFSLAELAEDITASFDLYAITAD